LNDDEKDSLSEAKSSLKEGGINFDANKLIYIRAEHLLNLTLTKTTLDLALRLQTMFNEAYQKGESSDSDEEQSMLSIHNQTGYNIIIHDILGLEVSFFFFF